MSETSLYTSLVGNSFNASIQNHRTTRRAATGNDPPEQEATLGGLSNSVTAVMDDILNGYASAQMMVARSTQITEVVVSVNAVRFGQKIYIVAVAAINFVIIIGVTVEAFRTRAWDALEEFDYMDPGDLVVGVARACEADDVKGLQSKTGRFLGVAQRGERLILELHQFL